MFLQHGDVHVFDGCKVLLIVPKESGRSPLTSSWRHTTELILLVLLLLLLLLLLRLRRRRLRLLQWR